MGDVLLTRDQVPEAHKWNIKALFESDEQWEAEFLAARDLPAGIRAYQGRLAESDHILAEALRTWFEANRKLEKLWVYAHLRRDEDLSNSKYQDMFSRAQSAYIALSTAGSFLAPEILSIDDETMSEWLKGEELCIYEIWLRDLLRGKPHTLSEAEERLLSMASEPLASFFTVFSVLKNVDLAARLPTIVDEEGREQKLTHALFIKLLESPNRDLRRETFGRYYAEFKGNRQTIAAALDGAVKAHIFQARARRFDNALEAALFDDNIPVSVYDSLVSAMHEALPAFYQYISLRRELLGLDELHMYDIYVPAVPQVMLNYSFEEAYDLICQALQPLGSEYVQIMREGLDEGWIDRYENVGKRSGAYSSGCYDSMPYVLMNFTGTLDSVFTLAHELGHSMHSWYSNHSQPYHLADYRIFVAEVASTTNEALLHHYLLNTMDDPSVRAYLIDRYLDNFRATMFRQTMFAEFERDIHTRVERGESLTVDALDQAYYELVRTYFGDAIAFDEEDAPIAWEWSRIDHFFYNFYVYKYATGMASAVAIANAILAGEQGARERYLEFLRSGSSKYPLELLRDAGVDLTSPVPVKEALKTFEGLIGQLEHLARSF